MPGSSLVSAGMTLSGTAGYPALHGCSCSCSCSGELGCEDDQLQICLRDQPGSRWWGACTCLANCLTGAWPKLAKEYGPLMSIRLGQAQYIVASSPQAAKEFLKTQDANFCSRPTMRAGQVMFGPDILFQSNSAEWRQLRKVFHSGLTGSKRLEATRHVREEEVAHLLRSLPRNCEFNLRKYLSLLVTGIIPRLIVNRSFSAHSLSGIHELSLQTERLREIRSFQGIMGAIFKGLSEFYPADFIPSVRWVLDFQKLDSHFRDTSKRMDTFATHIIADHQARSRLTARDGHAARPAGRSGKLQRQCGKNGNSNHHGQRQRHHDAFSEGTDTIRFSSEWIMSEVASNPSVQAAAQAELDREVGRQRRVQEADLPNLRYIQAVVKEILRLHPIAPLMAPHQSLHATKAFGYDIPTNTRLFVNVWAIAHDPAVWSDPFQFEPERWLGLDEADLGRVAAQCEFLPFGAGRRICPGMALAMVMLEHCVASLLQAFEWSVAANPGMAEAPGIGVPRALPLRVMASPRLSSQVMDS